jgi:hypothetical protein
VVWFGDFSKPKPEPERTVLIVRFGVLQGENQNQTEKPVILPHRFGFAGLQTRPQCGVQGNGDTAHREMTTWRAGRQ